MADHTPLLLEVVVTPLLLEVADTPLLLEVVLTPLLLEVVDTPLLLEVVLTPLLLALPPLELGTPPLLELDPEPSAPPPSSATPDSSSKAPSSGMSIELGACAQPGATMPTTRHGPNHTWRMRFINSVQAVPRNHVRLSLVSRPSTAASSRHSLYVNETAPDHKLVLLQCTIPDVDIAAFSQSLFSW